MLFRKTLTPVSETAWLQVRRNSALVAALDEHSQRRLRELAARFLQSKSIEPVQGLVLDDAGRALIAAIACVPLLELGLEGYQDWQSVVVYPDSFVVTGQEVDAAGVVHEFHEPRDGEAWHQGPVVLSFRDVLASQALDGHNVVIHEMAHKLDMLDGAANGRPPLHPGMDARAWYDVFDAAFAELRACLDAGHPPPIDAYASESPGEFFAVASEHFFERPLELERTYPAVFDQLSAWYRPFRA